MADIWKRKTKEKSTTRKGISLRSIFATITTVTPRYSNTLIEYSTYSHRARKVALEALM